MPETEPDTNTLKMQEKGMRPPVQTERKYPGERWAVIVGISDYQAKDLKLRYAHRDANELYNLITSSRGGAFPKDNVKKLTNKGAGYMQVNKALRGFLQKPKPEDLVLIYFSCHGAWDPGTGQVYLLCHDTEPDDIASTAQPMSVIQEVLRTTLKARHVVILIDACHGGAAVGSQISIPKGEINDAAIINRYLLEMGKAREGIAMLTSCKENQVAYEGLQWDKGHGVFTHCLLQGIKGDADPDETGVVRVGKLFDYVQKRVEKETGGKQQPVPGTAVFDPRLPMAVIGDISIAEHFELGCHLYEMGRLLPDKRCFNSAVHHLDQAISLKRELFRSEHPEALLEKGLVLIAQEKYSAAIDCFNAVKTGNDETRADSLFHQIVAYAKSGHSEASSVATDEFLTQYPADARGAWLQKLRQSCIRALIIGIGNYQDQDIPTLEGAASDVQLFSDLLQDRYGLHDSNRQILLDEHATHRKIVGALQELAEIADSGDQIVIYYTGWAETKSPGTYLLPVDYRTDRPDSAIGVQKLHEMICGIDAGAKTVVIDCAPSSYLIEQAKQAGDYQLYVAAQPGQSPGVQEYGDSKHGNFTYALVQALSATPDASLATLRIDVEKIVHKYTDPSVQTPVLQGDDSELLVWRHYGQPYLSAYDLSLRRVFYDLTVAELHRQAAHLTDHPLPTLPCAIARGFTEKKEYSEAIKTLEGLKRKRALQAEEVLSLGLADLGAQRYVEAQADLRNHIDLVPEHADQLAPSLQAIQMLQTQHAHALLVGIGAYANRDIPWVRGATNDVEGMRLVLIDKLGIPAENIKVLTNAKAKTSSILTAFSELVDKARSAPALFYYAGNGSQTTDGLPTILGYDARMAQVPNDILLADLARIVGDEKTNLVTVIDAGWQAGLEVPWSVTWGNRFVNCDHRPRPAERALRGQQAQREPAWTPTLQWLKQRSRVSESVAHLRVGWVSILPSSIQAALSGAYDQSTEAMVEAEFPSPFNVNKKEIHGALTWALLRIVLASRPEELTYDTLRTNLEQELQWLQPFVLCERSDERFLSNVVQEENVQKSIRELGEHQNIRRAIYLLRQQIQRNDESNPHRWLDLGIAYAAAGEHENSVEALRKAQGFTPDSADLHYWLGRVCFESQGDVDDAIGDLRAAKKKDPGNAAAQYYFIQAVLASIERKHLQELQEAWTEYTRLGAPLGGSEEIDAALKKLSTQTSL